MYRIIHSSHMSFASSCSLRADNNEPASIPIATVEVYCSGNAKSAPIDIVLLLLIHRPNEHSQIGFIVPSRLHCHRSDHVG